MGSDPFLILRSKGRLIEIKDTRHPSTTLGTSKTHVTRFIGNPFTVVKGLLKKYRSDFYSEIPFLGGAVGYFSYDLCHFTERLPSTAIDDIDIPDCCLGFYDEIVAIDHLKNKCYVIASEPKGRASSLPLASLGVAPRNDADNHGLKCNFTKEDYIAAIKRAKEYIRNGDIYQVNLSQRFETNLAMSPFELYKKLRDINPAPFACYLGFDAAKVIGSSPERFLKVDAKNRLIETRPIKGTRPRGREATQDNKLREELMASPKDRAEHIMIVDLERNDLGRVCDYGSVEWSEPFALEGYSTVFHLVSTVRGVLKKGTEALDCLKACFPGGSITGAPKIRSMEIIDELEPTKRAVYTGAVGYLGFNGNMDTSIAIRTFISKGDKLYFQVGGGIVADSDAETEYQETLDKAKALIEALKS